MALPGVGASTAPPALVSLSVTADLSGLGADCAAATAGKTAAMAAYEIMRIVTASPIG